MRFKHTPYVTILLHISQIAYISCFNVVMPWELGKLNTPTRLYDTSRVIWISTSNAGEDLVFQFDEQFTDRVCQRRDYVDLSTKVRRRLIDSLGVSVTLYDVTCHDLLTICSCTGVSCITHNHSPAFPGVYSS